MFNLSNVVSVPMPTSKPSKLHLLCNACIIILPLHQQPISLCMCVHVCVWTPLYLYWYYYYHQLQFAAIESPHGSRFTARLCCPHNFINRKEIISPLFFCSEWFMFILLQHRRPNDSKLVTFTIMTVNKMSLCYHILILGFALKIWSLLII